MVEAELVTAVIDTIGAVAFLIAGVYAYKNFEATKTVSDYWLVYAAAAFLGFVWAGVTALEKYGVYAQTLDQMVGALVSATATAFAIAALLTVTSLVQPTE